MCLTEYDEAETLQMIADENREEGRVEGRKEGREEGRVEGRKEIIDSVRKAKALIRSGKTTEEELVAEGIPEDVAAILLDVEPHKSRAKKSDRQIEISIEQRQEDIRRQTVERLVAYRKALGMTQQEIADALGVSRPNIGRFEKVDYNPTVDMIVKVADCMGLDVDIRFVKRKDR